MNNASVWNKTATESFRMLSQVYTGEECMSGACVFEQKNFCKGQEDVKQEEHCGCPCTSRTDTNVWKNPANPTNDRQLSITMIAEMVFIEKETVRKVLQKNMNMANVCVKGGPKGSDAWSKKKNRKRICADISEQTEANPIKKKVVTHNESWVFQSDHET